MTGIDSEEDLELVKNRTLTDEEAKKLANYEKAGWAKQDLHSRTVATVWIEDGEVVIGDPHAIEGGTQPRYTDDVIGTVGAGGNTPERAREIWRETKTQMVESYQYAQQEPGY